MPQGLQCFDANGNLILDVTDRLTRILGEVNTGTTSGSMVDNNFLSGSPFYLVQTTLTDFKRTAVPISVSISGNTLSWSFVHSYRGASYQLVPYIIVYGVY